MAGFDAIVVRRTIDALDCNKVGQLLKKYAGITQDEHGDDTPRRFLSMLSEITACRLHNVNECPTFTFRTFNAEDSDMIVIQGIDFVSVCNHHLLPFIGHADIGYIPNDQIAGLSKFAHVVKHFARQVQVQERMTEQIADYLEGMLLPMGLAVVLRAEHMCMTIRGAQAPGSFTTTSVMRGVFADHSRTAKAEFLQLVNGKRL